jgi:prepilin-type N-terminal cleavage/methylation domain-containing protein
VTLVKMMRTDKKRAFTLIEVLVTLAIILILAGALITAGKYLRVRAERQLTASAIEVISTALQQYYDQTGNFPPMIYSAAGGDGSTPQYWLKTALSADSVTVSSGKHPEDMTPPEVSEGRRWWSSETLFYFLDRVPQSKAILNGLSSRMLSNKGKTGVGLQVQISFGATRTTYDWVRFVDAWGGVINYEYTAGDAFPVLTSAGPDKSFQTTANNLSSR